MEIISGVVEEITFRNEQNGYTVCTVSTAGLLHTVVGSMPALSVGEEVAFSGEWMTHPHFGLQFKAEALEQRLPSSEASILRYLSSGIIKGVGPSTAQKIVECFGVQSLDVIGEHPEYLTRIKGISKKKAIEIGKEFQQQFGIRQLMMFLQEFSIGAADVVRIYQQWGPASADIIRKNPYELCGQAMGIGFEKADRIASGLGLVSDMPQRIQAGIIHVLQSNLSNGHTYLPTHKLLPVAASFLNVSEEKAAQQLPVMISHQLIVSRQIGGKDVLYLRRYFEAEKHIAESLQFLSAYGVAVQVQDLDRKIDALEREFGITYAPSQRQAIAYGVNTGVMILTGGPGTGKTTTTKGILKLLADHELRIALAAPTGRAAKRAGEVCGLEAKTIHRLLGMEYSPEGHEPVFSKNAENPLEFDALIIDEASMIDLMLMEALICAIKPGTRLILIGDADQLPAVGAGNVLRDMIDSCLFPTVQLTEIFRQARESLIVVNAHRINHGHMPELECKTGNFFFLPCATPAQTASTVVDLCARRLPTTYGIGQDDIQVLTPCKKTACGTLALNVALQEALNPAIQGKAEKAVGNTVFRLGDKVMQIRNNYDLLWKKGDEQGSGIFNGDIGTVVSVDQGIEVSFDGRICRYETNITEDLELAYAVTVHKSQGSEFPFVVLALSDRIPPMLLYRNLLYTAVTRARQMVIAVGSRESIQRMVENDHPHVRYSGLRHFWK